MAISIMLAMGARKTNKDTRCITIVGRVELYLEHRVDKVCLVPQPDRGTAARRTGMDASARRLDVVELKGVAVLIAQYYVYEAM